MRDGARPEEGNTKLTFIDVAWALHTHCGRRPRLQDRKVIKITVKIVNPKHSWPSALIEVRGTVDLELVVRRQVERETVFPCEFVAEQFRADVAAVGNLLFSTRGKDPAIREQAGYRVVATFDALRGHPLEAPGVAGTEDLRRPIQLGVELGFPVQWVVIGIAGALELGLDDLAESPDDQDRPVEQDHSVRVMPRLSHPEPLPRSRVVERPVLPLCRRAGVDHLDDFAGDEDVVRRPEWLAFVAADAMRIAQFAEHLGWESCRGAGG